jgi:hypothetical protein
MSTPFAELNKILHPLRDGRMFTLFFRTYLDESEDRETLTYVVGGFVGKATVWEELQPKWLAALPPNISYFHTTDCFRGDGEFSSMGIPERERILDSLTDLIAGHDIKLVAGTLDVTTYGKFAPKLKENNFGGNKYTAPLEFAIKLACESMDNSPLPVEIEEQCAFFMERNEYSPSAARKIAQLQKNTMLWWRNRIGTDSYGTKTGTGAIPLLQVADLGAYLSAKIAARAPQSRIPWWPYLDKLQKANRVFQIEQCDKASLELMFAIYGSMEKEIWDEIEESLNKPLKRDMPEN